MARRSTERGSDLEESLRKATPVATILGPSNRSRGSSFVSLRFHSKAIGYVQGDCGLVGIPMRLRAEWAGDVRNTRKTSTWRYAKFVRGSGRPDLGVRRGAGPAAARIG